MKKHKSLFITFGIIIIVIIVIVLLNINNKIISISAAKNFKTNNNKCISYTNQGAYIIDNMDLIISEYQNNSRFLFNSNERKLYIIGDLTNDNIKEIKSYYFIKYGTPNIGDLISIKGNHIFPLYSIKLNLSKEAELNAKIKEVNETITEISHQIKTDNVFEQMKQAADITRNMLDYDLTSGDIYSAVYEGRGTCNSYTIFYNMLLEKLGFKTEMCFGQTQDDTSAYHTWSKVIKAGKTYFCDTTYYETEPNAEKYIGLSQSPYKIKKTNKYYFSDDSFTISTSETSVLSDDLH